MIAYDLGFIGTPIAPTAFKKQLGLLVPKTPAARFATISANIMSTYQGGCFFGALLGYPVGVLLGRVAANDGARGLGPICAGLRAASNLTPLYISEIAPPAMRGQLVGMYECGWQIGGLVGFWLNYGISKHIPVSNKQWIIPFAIQLLSRSLFAIGLFIKESPRWFFSVGRRDEAIKSLCYLLQLSPEDPYIIEEVNMIDIQSQHDIAAVGARLLIVTTLFAFQNGARINAINYYSPTIFKSIGIQGSQTGLLATGIIGVIKTIGGFAWTFLIIDHFGRRGILLVRAIGGAAAMAVIAAYNFTSTTLAPRVTCSAPPRCLPRCRSHGHDHVRRRPAANWLYNFAIARATPTATFLKLGHSGWGVYLFFCICQIISVPYIIFLLPETKHVPLEEMDHLWQLSPWTANQKVMSGLRREHGQKGPAYLHQDKNQGSDERFEESSSEKNTV